MSKKGLGTSHLFTLLKKELQLLRKGAGLVVWKLEQAPELRVAVAKQLEIQPHQLTAVQTYAYLLHQIGELGNKDGMNALKNAYRLEPSLPSALTRRRVEFALQIERHPDTIKAYEDQAIDELAHRLLAPTHQADKQKVLPPVRKTDNQERALQRSAIESLGGLFEFGPHAHEIIRILGKSPAPYLDANVECILLPSKRGRGWYAYRYRYTFRSLKTTFRIGVTTSAHDTSVLIASGLFDEMIQLNESANFDEELPGIIGNCRFIVHDPETNIQQSLWFTEMDAPKRRELLGHVWQVDADACRVIELQVGPKAVDGLASYELRIDYDLRVNEHYAYWETPGLMYLNTLTIDISQFPEREKWQFFLKPFLGTTFTGSFDPNGNRFTLPASSWITAGQGIVVIWQEKAA